MTYKAVILSPSNGIWGGGQIYVESLSRFCANAGGSVPVATSEPGAFAANTLSIPRIDGRLRRLVESVKIADQFKRAGIRRVLLNDLSALWLAPVFRARGIKVASLLHLHPEAKTGSGLGHTRLERSLLYASSKACHRIFSVNRQNIDFFGSKVQFVGNYAPDEFFESSAEFTAAKKTYDVVFVARLAAQKDPHTFVKLVAELVRSRSVPVRALMIGDGPLSAEVDAAIKDLGLENVIERLPWVERKALPGLLDQAKCFVMTSLYEGFATTVIEAQARGLPVVTTETSGFCPEFVREFGSATGHVFDGKSVDKTSVCREIGELIDRSETLAPFCREKARRFTRESVLSPIRDWLLGSG